MAVAVVIQALTVAVLCAEQATSDEAIGRARLEEKDQGLVALRQRALCVWGAVPWTIVREGEGAVEGSLSDLEDGAGWVMNGATRQGPTISRLTTSAWLERGRDGIDLPLAALVAGSVSAASGREIPWVEIDVSDGAVMGPAPEAVGYVETLPDEPLLGDGCTLMRRAEPWRLDPGWVGLRSGADLEAWAPATAAAPAIAQAGDPDAGADSSLPAVAPGPRVAVLTGPWGHTLEIPDGFRETSPEAPILVVLTGGAGLDARGLGDLYGVLVVDDGGLALDGTALHGAAFVTEEVSLGETGRLLFRREILRWATDRSLHRTRLVPGTRWEGVE
ncbi:MAG: hypothetical protein LLG45_06315 [Actinomycetia bacterium]|nr:hypothetical protein [Actinomycetes bacterium]